MGRVILERIWQCNQITYFGLNFCIQQASLHLDQKKIIDLNEISCTKRFGNAQRILTNKLAKWVLEEGKAEITRPTKPII
jgi:hypothetical protein